MIFKRILFSILILTTTNLVIGATQEPKTTITEISTNTQLDFIDYTVKSGDTAYSIAALHGVSLKDLYKYNPDAEKGLKTGQKLHIPLIIVNYINHKIAPKETLYSVARLYVLPTNAIITANKGLDEKNFKAGKEIKIPVFNIPASVIAAAGIAPATTATPTTSATITKKEKITPANSYTDHRVVKGETLYSVSKDYGVSIDAILQANNLKGGLKEGEVIRIPGTRMASTAVTANSNTSINTPNNIKDEAGTRIAILLPFAEGSQNMDRNKILEMYNGFLLAVKNLKAQGKNAEIYTFDIGDDNNTKKLQSLLETSELNSMNLVIGGISKKQIDILSQFSKKTGIKYVIPLDSKSQTVYATPSVYRMTSSPSSLYPEVITSFINKYKNHNIIFATPSGSDSNKKDFTTALQQELTKANISFSTINSSANLASEINKAAKSTKQNVVIPTSSSDIALKQILTAIDTDSDNSYTLFGYPEWQIYTSLYSQLHKYDTTIYSIFFLNENQSKVVQINNEYKEWFNKPMINSYPKWGYLGYDMGLFFVSALNDFNGNFSQKISTFEAPTLQSAIHFEREKQAGGYINNGLYFVQFKVNNTIEKTECQ